MTFSIEPYANRLERSQVLATEMLRRASQIVESRIAGSADAEKAVVIAALLNSMTRLLVDK